MECFAAGWGKTKTTDSTRVAHQTEITLISRQNSTKIQWFVLVAHGGAPLICQADTIGRR